MSDYTKNAKLDTLMWHMKAVAPFWNATPENEQKEYATYIVESMERIEKLAQRVEKHREDKDTRNTWQKSIDTHLATPLTLDESVWMQWFNPGPLKSVLQHSLYNVLTPHVTNEGMRVEVVDAILYRIKNEIENYRNS